MPAAPVQLTVVQPTPIERASEYVSSIQSLSSTVISPEVSGQITKIYARSGERVETGKPLFQIDPRAQQAAVSSEEAARAAQEVTVTYMQQQLERAKTLLAAGAISQQQFEQAQTNAETAQKQLASLNARLQQERVTLRYYDVTSPVAGTVGDIPVRVGMRVDTGTVLTTVDRNQVLEVYVYVPLERSSDLRMGLPIEVFNGVTGKLAARTAISFISPAVDTQTQTVLVKGRVSNDNDLRALQFVRARIVWSTSMGLVVPVLSVVRINGQPFVFVAAHENGHLVARQRPIEVGPISGNDYPVTSGLAAGDRVVTTGVQRLANGAPIQPE